MDRDDGAGRARAPRGRRVRAHARQFDGAVVFDRMLERVNAHLTGRMVVLAV